MSTKKPNAWIASPKDNGRKSVKKIDGKDTVYLKNEEEFVIELFNPMKFCVLADIKLNGNSISNSGIVLNPGQRFYLDCFIDSNRKFIFKTYDVEDSKEVMEAISNNGVLEVKFYKETVKNVRNWPYMTTTNVNWDNGGFFNGYNNIFYSTSGIIDTRSKSNTLGDLILCSSSTKSIETGRVESGDISNQKFETVNMDFDSCVLTSVVVHMLPESRKPVEVTKKAISPSGASNFVELIKKLGELHSAGLLTDEEFKSKKSELLARI